jgi:hypothetical protein
MNRTGESGGSIGGNGKAGTIRFSSYPNISMGYFIGRVDSGECCRRNVDNYGTGDGGSSSDPVPPPPPPPSPSPSPSPGIGSGSGSDSGSSSGPSWGNNNNSNDNCTIVNSTTGGITTICDGAVSFQGNTLP